VKSIDYDPSELYFISGCGKLSLLSSPWNKLKSRKRKLDSPSSHAIKSLKTAI